MISGSCSSGTSTESSYPTVAQWFQSVRSGVCPRHSLAKGRPVNHAVDLDLKNGLLGRFREPAGRETDREQGNAAGPGGGRSDLPERLYFLVRADPQSR